MIQGWFTFAYIIKQKLKKEKNDSKTLLVSVAIAHLRNLYIAM